MSSNYGGAYLVPGMGSEFQTQEQQLWFGREEQQLFTGYIVDADLTDEGNTSYTHIIRPGLALGLRTTDNKLVAWNPYAITGEQRLFGFFCGQQNMQYLGAAADRLLGYIIVKGNLYTGRLLIPGETTYGIVDKTYEFLLREQMIGRFHLDDFMHGQHSWKEYSIAAATTALTVTTKMNRNIFVTDSALAADCTLTLPAPVPGLEFGFVHTSTTATTELILDGPATGEFWIAGAAANTLTFPGDNTTGIRYLRAVRVTDGAPDTFAYVLDSGVA